MDRGGSSASRVSSVLFRLSATGEKIVDAHFSWLWSGISLNHLILLLIQH